MGHIDYHKLETVHWCPAMLLDMGQVVDLAIVEEDLAGENSPAAAVDVE